jgi:hypothetical protein
LTSQLTLAANSDWESKAMRTLFLPSLFLLVAAISSGCSNRAEDKSVDRSFVSGVPCQAPCWYHLELVQGFTCLAVMENKGGTNEQSLAGAVVWLF